MNTTNARIAIVTGANKGIGFHVARKLGAAGVHVLVGARDAGRGEKGRRHPSWRRQSPSDVARPRRHRRRFALRRRGESESPRYGKLDILVNNAGIAAGQRRRRPRSRSKTCGKTYETNVFGVDRRRRTRSCRCSGSPRTHARIVNVSSGLGSFAVIGDNASKFYVRSTPPPTSPRRAALDALTLMLCERAPRHSVQDQCDLPGISCDGSRQAKASMPRTAPVDPAGGADIVVRMAMLSADGPSERILLRTTARSAPGNAQSAPERRAALGCERAHLAHARGRRRGQHPHDARDDSIDVVCRSGMRRTAAGYSGK